MADSKQIVNLHVKNYVKLVYEARLREEGFTCPNDKLLCWYRTKENGLYDTIVFHTTWSRLPVMIDIEYETNPLFFDPLYTGNALFNLNTHMRLDCIKHSPNCEIDRMNYAPFSNDISVFAPNHSGRGVYAFNEIILPELNQLRTVEDCYLHHKKCHADMYSLQNGRSQMFGSASREFVAEAVYLEDSEIYHYCRARVERAIDMYESLVARKPSQKDIKNMLEEWELLGLALFDDGREEFLKAIEQRKEKTIKQFQKWGVPLISPQETCE